MAETGALHVCECVRAEPERGHHRWVLHLCTSLADLDRGRRRERHRWRQGCVNTRVESRTHTAGLPSFLGPSQHHASQSGRSLGPLSTGGPPPRPRPRCPLFVKSGLTLERSHWSCTVTSWAFVSLPRWPPLGGPGLPLVEERSGAPTSIHEDPSPSASG